MDRWRVRWAIAVRPATGVAALVALVVLAAASAVAIAAGGAGGGYDPSSAPGASAAEDQARSAQQSRSTPEAKAERAQSRHRFANASNERALTVAKDSFPGPIGADVWRDVQLGPGEHVRRHLGTNSLLVDKAGQSGDAIVESNVPLEAKNESGALAPVELALQDRGSVFESRNPIVPVRYFKDARKGFEFLSSGIGVHPAGAPGPDASPVESVASKTFFPNVDTDTDFWVTPEPSGAQAQWQLRSQSSPETLSLDLELPRGAQLRVAGDGHGEIMRGDTQLAFVSPPAAVDASGQQVPVHYESSGPKLNVVVDHRGADVMYPILVDPSFNDCFDWIGGYFGCGTTTSAGPWQAQSYGPYYMFLNGPPDSGLTILGGAVAYTNGQWAEWYLDPWRSHITIPRAEFQTSERSQYTCTYTGLWTNPNQYRDTNCTWYDGRWNTQCLPQACSTGWDYIPASDKDFARATFGYYKLGAGTPCCTHWTDLRRSYIYYWDYYAPSVDIPDLGSRPWAEQDSATLTGSINDWGIGLASEHVRAAGAGGTPNPYDWSTGCPGDRSSPCPSSNGFPGGSLVLNTAAAGGFGRNGTAYREGVMPIYVDATERIGRTTTKRVAEFKIDRSSPAINPTGSLVVADGTWIKEGSYTLNDTPSDGLSGIQSDAFAVSNSGSPSGDTASTACNTSSGCPTNPAQHPWTWPASGPDGPHQVTVTATDPVGHPTTRSWNVNLDTRAPALSAGPSGSLWDQRTKAVDAGTYDLHASATDPAPGSGIQDIKVLVKGIEEDAVHASQSCNQTCPASMPRDYSFDTSGRSEGRYGIQLVAHDKVGHPGTLADTTIVLDTTPPGVTPSGSLWDARGSQLADGQYTLNVHASDGGGTDATARSGVQSVEIYLDDEQQDYRDQDCPNGSCSLDLSWTIDSSEISGGSHTVEMVATDQLGHVTRQTFSFTKPCCLAAASDWIVPAPTEEVKLGDVTGDGAADEVARDRLTGAVTVRPSNGSGFDTPQAWGTFSPAYDLHIADVDGDGVADVVGRDALGNIEVAFSTGDRLIAPVAFGSWDPARTLDFVDIDGDGAADAVGRLPATGDVSIGYSDCETTFEDPISIGTWSGNYSLAWADVDGDLRADAVGRDAGSGDIRVALQSDTGLAPASSWGAAPGNYDFALADVDGDDLSDIIVRDRDSDGIDVLSSSGSNFGAPAHWGSFSGAYALGATDVDGDGRADLAGQETLSGAIRVATSTAPVPTGPLAADAAPEADNGETLAPLPPVNLQMPPACPVPTTQTAGEHGRMLLAYQDDGKLLGRLGLLAPGTGGEFDSGPNGHEGQAICAINRLYARMRQSGASLVRFNVFWGRNENSSSATNPDGSPAPKYYWDEPGNKLDKAVDLARANGFRVELTFTGIAVKTKRTDTGVMKSNDDCSMAYNPHGRGCDNGGLAATGDDPDVRQFRDFVKEGVKHFTHDSSGAPLVRAQYFSIWNEPNLGNGAGGTWLNGPNRKFVAANRYGELYAAGYLGYRDGLAGVSGTSILYGELSSAQRSGMGAGKTCVGTGPKRRCAYTVLDFFDKSVTAASDYLASQGEGTRVPMSGLALHPYQHVAAPWWRGRHQLEYGIGKLEDVRNEIKNLCAADGSAHCTGQIKSLNGSLPRLYLTEFGYLNRGGNVKEYHREWTRAVRFSQKRTKRDGALQQALSHHAAVMVLYHLTEAPPNPALSIADNNKKWDSGLIAQPQDTPANSDDDIIGCRPYGKRRDGRGWRPQTGAHCPTPTTNASEQAQMRRAYCAIRRWAAGAGFGNRRGIYANACN